MYRISFIVSISIFLLVPPEARSQAAPENTLQDCSDQKDNDGNGLVDCGDPGCADLKVCILGSAPIQPSAENTAAACIDGADNDGDGFVDCADQDCSALKGCAALVAVGENTAAACGDGLDNDGNGFIDCKDPGCAVFVFCAAQAGAPALAPQPRSSGWALAGGIIGLVALGPITGLVIGSEVTNGDTAPSLAMGSVALVLHIAFGPVAAAGAASARRSGFVRGCLGCRIAGWIFYGLAILDGLVLVGLGAAELDVPSGVISTVGILGVTSLILQSVDALTARRQVVQMQYSGGVGVIEEDRRGIAWTPILQPTLSNGRITGATLGVGMAF